jgi:hypothetical protein
VLKPYFILNRNIFQEKNRIKKGAAQKIIYMPTEHTEKTQKGEKKERNKGTGQKEKEKTILFAKQNCFIIFRVM